MTQEQIQYAYMQQLRRRSLYRQKQLQNIKLQKIQNIRNFIAAGGDPSTDPHYKDDYFALFAESNGAYFVFDDNVGKDVRLTKEEEDV